MGGGRRTSRYPGGGRGPGVLRAARTTPGPAPLGQKGLLELGLPQPTVHRRRPGVPPRPAHRVCCTLPALLLTTAERLRPEEVT